MHPRPSAAKAALWIAAALVAGAAQAGGLTVVVIRHGEKSKDGENLSCQGENRALALPSVLETKFGKPDYTYVPSMKMGKSTHHVRMFQTVTPFAVADDLDVDTSYAEDDVKDAAKDVLSRKGTVLMVWEHTQIAPLAQALGVPNPPAWDKDDYDGIWVVTPSGGTATLVQDAEGLSPSSKCKF